MSKMSTRCEYFKSLGISIGGASGVAVSLTLAVGANCAFCTLCSSKAIAQITPDTTLPSNSTVKLEGNTKIIEGGTRAGGNLFHSFVEFSVRTGETAHFNNVGDIQNIFGRVTGKSISNIDGTLRANGTANLFLINPNGIIFGKGASLNIGGSFLASTASSLKFADSTEFSAIAPQTTPLLTISVPIGLQYGSNPGSILNQSQAKNTSGQIVGLQVQPSKTLALVGGDVELDGGNLRAPNGRVELGGVALAGTVGLNVDGLNIRLSFPDGVTQADVVFSNRSFVSASSTKGGDIQFSGRQITLTDGSTVLTGDGGNIQLSGKQVTLTDGSEIGVITLGEKSGGTLSVTASDYVKLIGASVAANGVSSSGLFNESYGVGSAGDIKIDTRQLIVRDGGMLKVANRGSSLEKKGNLVVNASDSVELIGVKKISANVYSVSGLYNQTNGIGNAGDLSIATHRLVVRDGAQVSTSTSDTGRAGNVDVKASESVEVIGRSADGNVGSGLFAQTYQGTMGDAGNLNIATKRLVVRDGAQVSTGTGIDSQGKGGNLTVTASDFVEVTGRSPDGRVNSSSKLVAQTQGAGSAGDLTINTGQLVIRDGGQVSSATFGAGRGGFLTVNASNSVELSGFSKNVNDQEIVSGLYTQVNPTATGTPGNLRINTGKLIVRNGAEVSASTLGTAPGGSLTVNASDVVEVSGTTPNLNPSSLTTQTFGSEAAGDLTITTRSLNIQNGAEVTVSSVGQGSGSAGNLKVAARSIQLNNQSKLTAQTDSGKGGNIELSNLDLLLMRHSSSISTTAGKQNVGGDGGNINIDTKFIVAVPNENSDITANAFSGSGGRVQINATGIFGLKVFSRKDLVRLLKTNDLTQIEFQQLPSSITAISQTSPNLNGQVNLNTPDVDINRGLVSLPIEVVDATGLINQNFCAASSGSSFTITGRGGLPPSPNSTLNSDAVWEDWRLTAVPSRDVTRLAAERRSALTAKDKQPTRSTSNRIVEAQGLAMNAKGEVFLTANPSTVTPHSSWHPPTKCP